jgi:hypothetical protein
MKISRKRVTPLLIFALGLAILAIGWMTASATAVVTF